MSAISSKAALRSLSAYKYNAGSELEDEGGLNYYNTFYRKYDAQIGRFTGIDVQAESFAGLTPFQFGNNNPVFFNDPFGDKFDNIGLSQKGPDGDYHVAWVTEFLWNAIGFFDFSNSEDGGGGGGGGGGHVFHSFTGISSEDVLNRMNFDDKFVKNKSKDEYGFWEKNNHDGRIGDGKKNPGEVIITQDWIPFDENTDLCSNSQRAKFGSLSCDELRGLIFEVAFTGTINQFARGGRYKSLKDRWEWGNNKTYKNPDPLKYLTHKNEYEKVQNQLNCLISLFIEKGCGALPDGVEEWQHIPFPDPGPGESLRDYFRSLPNAPIGGPIGDGWFLPVPGGIGIPAIIKWFNGILTF